MLEDSREKIASDFVNMMKNRENGSNPYKVQEKDNLLKNGEPCRNGFEPEEGVTGSSIDKNFLKNCNPNERWEVYKNFLRSGKKN